MFIKAIRNMALKERCKVCSADVDLRSTPWKLVIKAMNGNLIMGNIQLEVGGGRRVASKDISKINQEKEGNKVPIKSRQEEFQ